LLKTEAKKENRMAQQYFTVLNKNGETQNHLGEHSFHIEHICKGGFRFLTKEEFELEDRIQVQLRFPDKHTQEVLGRICYSDAIDADRTAYGFSVLNGFYASIHLTGCS
jgi:hypothetical protein